MTPVEAIVSCSRRVPGGGTTQLMRFGEIEDEGMRVGWWREDSDSGWASLWW